MNPADKVWLNILMTRQRAAIQRERELYGILADRHNEYRDLVVARSEHDAECYAALREVQIIQEKYAAATNEQAHLREQILDLTQPKLLEVF